MASDLEGLIKSIELARFERIAVQVHDSKLGESVKLLKTLTECLPEAHISLLGDSVTECCLDETSAEHYGSECIVKVGHCCCFASQRLVSYLLPDQLCPSETLIDRINGVRSSDPGSVIFLFVDSVNQGFEVGRFLATFAQTAPIFVCCSPAMSFPGSNKPGISWLSGRPFSSLGIRTIAYRYQSMRRGYPRVVGRLVFRINSNGSLSMITDRRELDVFLDSPSTFFIAPHADSLYGRLVNRFGTQKGRVLCCEDTSGVCGDSNFKELLRRYRGVEAVKNASCIGLVVTHCAASDELFKVRDLLSQFLRSQGKDVYVLSVNKPEGVKLGNFADIDCFVIMSCPETEYFESDDLVADCVSAYEALVACGSLDWSDSIITDYEEMLAKMSLEPPPRTPRTPRVTRHDDKRGSLGTHTAAPNKKPPAKIEMGLRGIPSRYVSEPPQ
jgi:diphthamide biosynthesis protein 2